MNTLVVVFCLKGIFLCCAVLISKNVLSHLIFHFNPGYLGCFVELVMLLPCFLQKANKVLLKQNDVKTYFLI